MNKIVQIKIFNDILEQFFDYLETNFPFFKSDIVLTRSTSELVRRSNPRLLVEQFMTAVMPYQKHIYNCDEEFFLGFEKNLNNTLTSDNIMFAMKIKNMWLSPETTQVQKAYIWGYFQKMLVAGQKVMS